MFKQIAAETTSPVCTPSQHRVLQSMKVIDPKKPVMHKQADRIKNKMGVKPKVNFKCELMYL
jgi:hypothetical protein